MFNVTDQTGAVVQLEAWPPRRIVSLVPSQTELLHYLGLEDEVAGITKFCIHPRHWFAQKPRVGGTKDIDINKVLALTPQLVIANKEENVRAQVEALRNTVPVWVSDVNTLRDACNMVTQVGLLTGKQQQAESLASQIEYLFSKLRAEGGSAATNHSQHPYTTTNPYKTIRVAYLIWQQPYMAAGGGTFIGDMLRCCGFTNVFENEPRYPQVTVQQLAELQCSHVFLSSEPYPFKQQHADALRSLLPGVQPVLVNGEMFSWYGSRLLLATQYFKELREHLLNEMSGFGNVGMV